MEQSAYLSGNFLLAMPGMADPRFERAIIAMAVHDKHGAVGIGIGHTRAGIRFRDLLRQLDIDPAEAPDCAVLHGGPVEPGRGFVLHSDDWSGPDTIAVACLGAMTGTIDVLKAIAEDRGPSRWLVALGYAGWSAGQLDAEMSRHGWLAAKGSDAILFDTPTEQRWEAAFRAEGIDPRLLVGETGLA
ncbi:MAG: YqgE/AlgH family protein [Sphingomicrobium sp.]